MMRETTARGNFLQHNNNDAIVFFVFVLLLSNCGNWTQEVPVRPLKGMRS